MPPQLFSWAMARRVPQDAVPGLIVTFSLVYVGPHMHLNQFGTQLEKQRQYNIIKWLRQVEQDSQVILDKHYLPDGVQFSDSPAASGGQKSMDV